MNLQLSKDPGELRKYLTEEQKGRIRKLVEYLRTTKRKQGRGILAQRTNKSIKYCCLGLACELAMAEGLPIERTRTYPNAAAYQYGTDKSLSSSVLPQVVREWYGFSRFDPILSDEDGFANTASGLNDDSKYNFKRIADAFERTYLSE